jgi:peroxisome-assembly ATPase
MIPGHDEQFAFKRAASRIYEMIGVNHARGHRWTPTPAAERRWELSGSPTAPAKLARSTNNISFATQTSMLGNAGPNRNGPGTEGADFAYEAANCDVTRLPSSRRPAAPKLKDDHFWGVRDDWNEGESRHTQQRNRGSSHDGE